MRKPDLIPCKIVPSVERCDLNPRQVDREFSALVRDGARFRLASSAVRDHRQLFQAGLRPKHKVELFDTTFYFSNVRQIPELRFFVCYIVQSEGNTGRRSIYPRIIYKDLSLVWRAASHFTYVNGDIWVGKGDVRMDEEDGHETIESVEATTDLPLEMQSAVESLPGWTRRVMSGDGILEMVLRRGPANRVEPYADFTRLRRRAQAVPGNLINAGRRIARFRRAGDPESLVVTRGFEPDFREGVIERGESFSRLYGGRIGRYRILSTNRKVQYYFLAGLRHVWIVPPQALTTELSSYGLRTVDVKADEDLFIPGYEYHHYEDTAHGRELYSQIPPGYVGEVCPLDDAKADASPWLNRIPLIRQFRQQVADAPPAE